MAEDPRDRLALALDVDDLVVALRLARRLRPWFGVAKVGLELFAAAGTETVSALVDEGYRVFLDLKLHDIPTTVARASRVLGGLGVAFATVHTQGGEAMMAAAVSGMSEGASAAGAPAPCVLGVTVLTSDAAAPTEVLASRSRLAAAAGCGGLVCAASDLAVTREAAPALLTMVPGIRPSGTSSDDQARAATPAAAIAAGADVLVIGRAVTGAEDPEAMAAVVAREVASSVADQRGMTPAHEGAMVARMPQPPALTPEQRQAALDKAARVRRERAEVKEKLKMGSITLSELLTRAEKDETVGKMKVLSVLESLPGLGKVKARRLMETVGISESRRLQGLGANQRDALLTHTSKS